MTEQRTQAPEYPVRVEIDYPEAGLNRVTTAFRLILAIPIAVIAGLLTTSATDWAVESVDPWLAGWAFMLTTGGYTVVPVLLMILVRGKYPGWWFDWNLELSRFEGRLFAYLALLRDEHPSTDDQQAVHLDVDYPDAARDLSRWLPFEQGQVLVAGESHFSRAVVKSNASMNW